MSRYDLTDFEWRVIEPLLPNKPRGVPRVDDGAVVNNEAMVAMYPSTFRPGSPAYLERDFEAGADFICDEIKVKYQRDICSEPDINWR